jgi:ATP-dependent Clp protease ATP-binding subunit ClpB
MREHFRPEFLNRIDEIVIFNRLSAEQLDGIVRVQLKQLEKRLHEKRITLEYDPSAFELLAKKGFDPVFGARPLKRAIQAEILNPLAREMIAGRVKSGDTVKIRAEGDHIVFDANTVPPEELRH